MANETNYVSSMTPSLYRVHHKLEQYENVNNPIYLLQNEYVPNTPFMRVLAKDILFCRYQFQSLDNDSNLFNDGTDYEKLRMLLRFDYGIDLNVGYYFKRHRLFRLMQYVDSNISQECRKAVLNRGQAEKELSEKLLQLIGDC